MKVVSFLVLIIKVDSFCFSNLVKHIHRIRDSWSWKTSLGSCGLRLFKLLTTAPYCSNVIFQEELLCLLRGRGLELGLAPLWNRALQSGDTHLSLYRWGHWLCRQHVPCLDTPSQTNSGRVSPGTNIVSSASSYDYTLCLS